MESPQGDDDRQWLTYWIVYSTFNILEYFADLILFWIPMYDLIKVSELFMGGITAFIAAPISK